MKKSNPEKFFHPITSTEKPLELLLKTTEQEINNARAELLMHGESLLTALRNEENWTQMPQTKIIFSAEIHTLNNLLSGVYGHRQHLEMYLEKLKIDKEAPLQILEQNPDSFLQKYLRNSLESLVKYKKLREAYNNRIIKKEADLAKKQQTDKHLSNVDVDKGGTANIFGFDGWKTLQE